MKDIINKNIPCELFNLENGETFSLSPKGKLYTIYKIDALHDFAVCSWQNQPSSNPAYCRFKLSKLVYPRNISRTLYLKRHDLFSSIEN